MGNCQSAMLDFDNLNSLVSVFWRLSGPSNMRLLHVERMPLKKHNPPNTWSGACGEVCTNQSCFLDLQPKEDENKPKHLKHTKHQIKRTRYNTYILYTIYIYNYIHSCTYDIYIIYKYFAKTRFSYPWSVTFFGVFETSEPWPKGGQFYAMVGSGLRRWNLRFVSGNGALVSDPKSPPLLGISLPPKV